MIPNRRYGTGGDYVLRYRWLAARGGGGRSMSSSCQDLLNRTQQTAANFAQAAGMQQEQEQSTRSSRSGNSSHSSSSSSNENNEEPSVVRHNNHNSMLALACSSDIDGRYSPSLFATFTIDSADSGGSGLPLNTTSSGSVTSNFSSTDRNIVL